VNIAVVPVADIDRAWPHIAASVVKCLEKAPSYATAGEFWQMCRSGNAFLIVAVDGETIKGASIWQFGQAYGRAAFSCLLLVGTQLEKWSADLVAVASEMARSNGAIITADGRIGLIKALKKTVPGLKVVRQSYILEV
jgi:hypothetical protein